MKFLLDSMSADVTAYYMVDPTDVVKVDGLVDWRAGCLVSKMGATLAALMVEKLVELMDKMMA